MSSYHCGLCNLDLDITSRTKHNKSFKHILRVNTLNENSNEGVKPSNTSTKITPDKVITPDIPQNVVKESNEFISLDDLRNDKFIPSSKKDTVLEVKEVKIKEKKAKRLIEDDDNESVLSHNKDLFNAKGTRLFGKENLELLSKIKQYKLLFPKELSKFRIKKNATDSDLVKYLEEMEAIINVSSVDTFVIDAILSTIGLCEGFTKKTRFDISGLSVMLKMNPQFNLLAKQLFLKYGSFSAIPPEQQLLLLVFTSAYICVNQNQQKHQMETYLDQPATHQEG